MQLKLLCMYVLVLTCVAGISQPIVGKQIAIGGSSSDYFRCMALTNDSGVIAGGYSYSPKGLNKTESRRGSADYWIVKLNKQGKIEWDKTIGGNKSDELQSIQQTIDGGYILGGSSLSDISGEKTESKKGQYDFWVVKTDATGNVEWDKTIGGNNDDYLYSIKQTNDGGFIAGGFSNSNISGDKTENRRGLEDYWVVKLDGTGDIQWNKTIGGNSGDVLTDIIETTDNGYLLGGHSSSNISGEKTADNKGDADYWIVKLDNTGSIQWDKTIGGASGEAFYQLQQTTDGGYILGGQSSSDISGDKTEVNRGITDYWIVKTDADGNIQWNKTIGGEQEDFFNALQQTRDSGYIIGGSSYSNISGNKTENSRGGLDYWIVKLNKSGKIQWDKTIGGDGYDECFAITEIRKNQYLIGGFSTSNISGDKTKPTANGDYWLVELDFSKPVNIASSTGEVVMQEKVNYQNFSFYPNPAKDILHIQSTGKSTVTVTDQSGKILITKTFSGNADINVSHLPAGLYYLKNIETGIAQKIMITK